MSEKVTKSYGELLVVSRGLNFLLSDKSIAASKTGKKLEKIAKKVQPHLDAYNEKLEDIKLDNANVDQSGSLIFDDKGGYKYTKEGMKKMNAKINELLKSEFEFYKLSFSPEGLEDYTFLSGWVDGISVPQDVDADIEE